MKTLIPVAAFMLVFGVAAGALVGIKYLAPHFNQDKEEAQEEVSAAEAEPVDELVEANEEPLTLPPAPVEGGTPSHLQPGAMTSRLEEVHPSSLGVMGLRDGELTEADFRLVETLAERADSVARVEKELAGREAALNAREALIGVQEESVIERRKALDEELAAAKEALKNQEKAKDDTSPKSDPSKNSDQDKGALAANRAARVADLTKKVQAMKPQPAAAMLAEVETAIAVDVLEKLNSRSAGAILNKMPPSVSAKLGEQLVKRKGPLP